MKHILIFQMPAHEYEYNNAVNGHKWRSVVHEMAQFLRQKTKYADDSVSDKELAVYNEVKDRLWEELQELGLDPYSD
jgi:hypothetical protein